MKYKIANILIFLNTYLLFSQTDNETMFLHQLKNTQEQFTLAYNTTVDLRRLLIFIFVFLGLRFVGIIIRAICYFMRIKLPVWLDMIL